MSEQLEVDRVTDKGFAFLKRPSEHKGQIFLHRSGMSDGPNAFGDLQPGDKVTADVTQGPKGPRAENARLVD